MSTLTAKDLTKEHPRSPLEELGGYPWLARLIDKVRALHAGKIGDYTPYPCGGDRGFIATIGVDTDALGSLIKSGASDEEVVAWVKSHQSPDAPEKLAAYRTRLLAPAEGEMAEYLKGAVSELKAARPELDTSKVDNFTRLICLDEGHPCPGL